MMAASAEAHQRNQEETDMDATTVAVDLAKSVFELAIADPQWHIVERKRFNRTAVHALPRATRPRRTS